MFESLLKMLSLEDAGSMGRQVAEVEVCDSSGKAAISTGGNFLCGSNFKEQKTTRFQSAM